MGQQTWREEPDGRFQGPARILVVDDDVQILGLLWAVLRAAGYAVETRTDGASALEALSAERFDLVTTDLAMPGLSGEAVLAAAKALEPPVPVVIITARASDREAARLRRMGADDIVLKPFQARELVSIVERLLARSGPNGSDC